MMNDQSYTREELLHMEILTPKEARNFIKDRLHISDTYYYDSVKPLIQHKFHPLLKDLRRGRPAMLVILKKDVEDFIVNHMKKLVRNKRGDI